MFESSTKKGVMTRNQFVEKSTWEAEEGMKKRYPHLFEFEGSVDQGTNFLLNVLLVIVSM